MAASSWTDGQDPVETILQSGEGIDVEWHPRTKTPPRGLCWASDGNKVWLIHNDGEPIPDYATAVLWWTTALIPSPPGSPPGIA
jgi:hypothetical protein